MTKRFSMLTFVSLLFLSIVSCSKDEFRNFEESYSYKVSGKLTLLPQNYADSSAAVQAGKMQEVPLVVEQGQMRVFDEGDNHVTLTFNDMTGNVTVSKGMLDGKRIMLEDGQEKQISLSGVEALAGKLFVNYSGEGKIYDSAILFDLKYSGTFNHKRDTMMIVDSRIECVAVEND